MADFGPDILDDVLKACRAGLAEAAAAFSRTFDQPIELALGDHASYDAAYAERTWRGPGLIAQLFIGPSAAVVLVPEAGGILPAWYTTPDPTGQSKLTTLAQELGMLLLPELYMPVDFKAAHVPDLAAAIVAGGAGADATRVDLQLSATEGKQAIAALIWPVHQPESLFAAAAPTEAATSAAPAVPASPARAPAAAPAPTRSATASLRPLPSGELPVYSRSLLKIKVPVVVTLATTKLPVKRITELVPGAIIQFDKSCEELLELSSGGSPLALGEAVKIGDKFGLRLRTIVLPQERFAPVVAPR